MLTGVTASEDIVGEALATVSTALPEAPLIKAPIAVDPAATAEATPEALMVATDELELVQVVAAVTSWVLPSA